MDVCQSPEDRSYEARPPAAEFSAAAISEGDGDVGGGKRSSAATRLNYEDITVTAQGQGTCPVPVEGADSSIKSKNCLLYTSPSPRDRTRSRMPSSA